MPISRYMSSRLARSSWGLLVSTRAEVELAAEVAVGDERAQAEVFSQGHRLSVGSLGSMPGDRIVLRGTFAGEVQCEGRRRGCPTR
jgi:hypothetical protein